jgi:LEA14-like dessication related protein
MSKIFSRKKLVLGIIASIIITALAFFIVLPRYISCRIENYTSNAEITGIALREISLSSLEMDVTVRVQNPNPIGAVVDQITYDIYFQQNDDWVYLGRGDRSEDAVIGSHDVVNLTVTHEVSTISTILMILGASGQNGDIALRVIGSVWLKIGPLTIEAPIDQIKQVALWR